MDRNFYLGLDWIRNITCNTSREIEGLYIGGPRWYQDPVQFIETGIKGVKTAATPVVNFETEDMWSGIVDLLINMGWYSLYACLTVAGVINAYVWQQDNGYVPKKE